MLFRSKVDAPIILLAMIPIAVALITVAILARGDMRPVLIALVPIGVVSAFVIRMLNKTDYLVDGGDLRIRSCFLTWRIAIDSISSVKPSRSMASAPALSLDRLSIHYWEGGSPHEILVSPIDKSGFIAALREVNPSIRT